MSQPLGWARLRFQHGLSKSTKLRTHAWPERERRVIGCRGQVEACRLASAHGPAAKIERAASSTVPALPLTKLGVAACMMPLKRALGPQLGAAPHAPRVLQILGGLLSQTPPADVGGGPVMHSQLVMLGGWPGRPLARSVVAQPNQFAECRL